jgi:hypothetical protein
MRGGNVVPVVEGAGALQSKLGGAKERLAV